MADSSFDVVSKVDRQEVDNALNQAAKELTTRFDFRGTDTTIEWQGEEGIILTSSTEERAKAAVDVPLAVAIVGLGVLIVLAPASVPGLMPPM